MVIFVGLIIMGLIMPMGVGLGIMVMGHARFAKDNVRQLVRIVLVIVGQLLVILVDGMASSTRRPVAMIIHTVQVMPIIRVIIAAIVGMRITIGNIITVQVAITVAHIPLGVLILQRVADIRVIMDLAITISEVINANSSTYTCTVFYG